MESLRAVRKGGSIRNRLSSEACCAGDAAFLFATIAMLVVSDALPFLKDKVSVKELFRFGKFESLSRSL